MMGMGWFSGWRGPAAGALVVVGLGVIIAASPNINQTVAIVDPYTPSRQAVVTAGGALTVTGTITGSSTVAVDQTTPGTTNGVQVNAALPAGTALIGKVGIDQTTPGTTDSVTIKTQAYAAAVSVTRTADTNVYAANDVIGAATGSTAALTFPTIGPSGKEVVITSVALEVDITAVVSGMTSFRLYLYNVTPPSALGDNAPFDLPSGDRASYLGYVDLGTPVDLGSTLYVETNGVQKQLTLAGTSLFGYLVTIGTWTPAASSVFKITLHTVAP